ncbi:hypothetical protein BDY24DRAFT_440085 [Mrakia frigida]|uniref:SGNH/GDSL hydrolase family protein n=1 Tax=Mrakia frigida TaxID=29902 RepID=UPI003FCBF924
MTSTFHFPRFWRSLVVVALLYIQAQEETSGVFETSPNSDHFTCDRCLSDPDLCRMYGSRNIDLSRAFDGTGARVRRVLEKGQQGIPIKTAILGGSVSRGHGCGGCETWHEVVFDWVNATFPHPENAHIDGSVGARGSDYFKFCHAEHIGNDADLILLEMSVNDFRMGDPAFENFETLLRAILNYPSKPAVIVLHTFKVDGIIATGGDSQLSLAEYYDVPVISARNWLLPLVMKSEKSIQHFFNYFVYEHGTDNILERRDLLHPNANGHRALGDTINIYLAQQLCFLTKRRPQIPPAKLPFIPQDDEYDIDVLPRMRLNRQFENDLFEPDLQPRCASLDSASSPLEPVELLTQGWDLWTMPGSNGEKTFWRGQKVGDRIVFELELVTGAINAYFLKSAKWDLGMVECWLDDDKKKVARIDGYWDRPQSVGQYQTLFDGSNKHLKPGKHLLTCEIIKPTKNPNPDAHSFLFIGLFSV